MFQLAIRMHILANPNPVVFPIVTFPFEMCVPLLPSRNIRADVEHNAAGHAYNVVGVGSGCKGGFRI